MNMERGKGSENATTSGVVQDSLTINQARQSVKIEPTKNWAGEKRGEDRDEDERGGGISDRKGRN